METAKCLRYDDTTNGGPSRLQSTWGVQSCTWWPKRAGLCFWIAYELNCADRVFCEFASPRRAFFSKEMSSSADKGGDQDTALYCVQWRCSRSVARCHRLSRNQLLIRAIKRSGQCKRSLWGTLAGAGIGGVLSFWADRLCGNDLGKWKRVNKKLLEFPEVYVSNFAKQM